MNPKDPFFRHSDGVQPVNEVYISFPSKYLLLYVSFLLKLGRSYGSGETIAQLFFLVTCLEVLSDDIS